MDYVKLRFGGIREEDLSDVSPWTPKNFSCSFCKREFRTAQALGGHMNVHRRDRARLRLLPPPNFVLSSPPPSSFEYPPYPNFNSNPNPNPKSPSSSSSSVLGSHKYLVSFPQSAYASTPSSGTTLDYENKKLMMRFNGGSNQDHAYSPLLHPKSIGIKRNSALDYDQFDRLKGIDGFAYKHVNMVREDLNMGLIIDDPNKEEVDLELRLGHL